MLLECFCLVWKVKPHMLDNVAARRRDCDSAAQAAQLDPASQRAGIFLIWSKLFEFLSFHISDMLVQQLAPSCVQFPRCPFVCMGYLRVGSIPTFSHSPKVNWVNWDLHVVCLFTWPCFKLATCLCPMLAELQQIAVTLIAEEVSK